MKAVMLVKDRSHVKSTEAERTHCVGVLNYLNRAKALRPETDTYH